MSDSELATTTNKINRHPSHEEVLENVAQIIELMSKGYTDPLDINRALKDMGINWSRNKIQNYISAANSWIDKIAFDTKGFVDQRHILVKKSEAVEQTLWKGIEGLMNSRKEVERKLNNGTTPDQLTWEETQIANLELDKLENIKIKAFQIILKAQERQSELYGYKNDKTILIKKDKGQKLKYEDEFNEDLIKKYRNIGSNEVENIVDAELIEHVETEDTTDALIETLSNNLPNE